MREKYTFLALIKTYYSLTKPGIVYGNAITAVGGFFLGARGTFDVVTFLAMLAGISLVMASACVFNNYIDRDIDKVMARTKKRAIVQGIVIGRNALIYAGVLGIAGIALLAVYTNMLTTSIAFLGFFAYVVLYGIGKRHSVHGTIVGSISGAVPPVVGYCAVSGVFDTGALLLFLVLVCWQMPHFYAIAMYRLDDYKAAKIPVLPVKKGMRATKIYILAYIALFTIAASSLTLFGYTGYVHLIVMALLGLAWFQKGLKGFHAGDDPQWARAMFRFSLIVIMAFSLMLMLNALLP